MNRKCKQVMYVLTVEMKFMGSLEETRRDKNQNLR
jgi:hypothetical protein